MSNLSFTDFKINIGIKDNERDTEYASILKGLIRELYTIYGIAIDKDVKDNSETITAIFDTPIQLAYKNIVDFSISTYTEGTDYTLDKEEGTLVILSSGTMIETTDYTVVYSYYVFVNESNEVTLIKNPEANQTTFYIDIYPYVIKSINYKGNVLTLNSDYYVLGNRVIFITPFTDIYTPIIFNLTVGYENTPYDLKQALYELASYRMERKLAKADLISRVEDNNGTATSYRNEGYPKHLKDIFMAYMGKRLAFS